MARPHKRQELKDYCLRALGQPMIEVNVEDSQVEDRIDEALEYYANFHHDGGGTVTATNNNRVYAWNYVSVIRYA